MRRTTASFCAALSLTMLVSLLSAWPSTARGAPLLSTGAINNYGGNGNLSDSISEANAFRDWFIFAGSPIFSQWTDGNVWGSDFRDQGSPNDMEPQGGSDRAQVYFYTGHGSCPSSATTSGSVDYFVTHGNAGQPDFDHIPTDSVWGNNGGKLRFMLIDASCPTELPEITQLFPVYGGVHIVTGNSGYVNGKDSHDTLDSTDRGNMFAVYLVGTFPFPKLTVTDAWMTTGTIDVQSNVCAVSAAAGNTKADAINHRDNEFVTSNFGNPSNNWMAWRWVCAN